MHRDPLLVLSGIAAAAAASAAFLSHSLSRLFVRMALCRELPGNLRLSARQFAATPELDAVRTQQKEAAQRLEAATEPVQLTARDGVPLVGHLYRCENAQRTILALHGWRSSWRNDFALISEFWQQNGCSVLYAEQRAQGASGGETMGFGLLERFDCLDWLAWLEAQGISGPVYLAGISMGASTILLAAGLPLPDSVRGLMADCGYTSARAIWKHVFEQRLHLPCTRTRQRSIDRACRALIGVGSDEATCPEALSRCPVPVLFIHGEADQFVPPSMTQENFAACAAPKQLFLVPGAGHGTSYLLDRPGYESAVKKFWQTCEH